MTVILQLDAPHDPTNGSLAAHLQDLPDSKREELISGLPVSCTLRVEAVAALMLSGVRLAFPPAAANSDPQVKARAVRLARLLASGFDYLEVPEDPKVRADSARGGFWVDTRVFVKV